MQIEPRVEVGKNSSVKDRTVTWEDEGSPGKQEILLHLVAETRFQSIEVFCGDVEFDAVSAELDFVDAFMETVRNEPVFADEIVFEFIGHGIQLPIGKFEEAARLFLFGFVG